MGVGQSNQLLFVAHAFRRYDISDEMHTSRDNTPTAFGDATSGLMAYGEVLPKGAILKLVC